MSIEEIRNYCLTLPYAAETMPFDDTTLVYKVGGKWFAVVDIIDHDKVVVKCDPDLAIELRDRHEEVTTAWHFNKRHWSDVRVDGDLPEKFVKQLIFNSYIYTIHHNVTPKARREELLKIIETKYVKR
jgi:predicted DNA-binding protein (MmcQ/YjbR family)